MFPRLRHIVRVRQKLYLLEGGPALQATGTLIFRVYTSNANIPVEGATVVVQSQDAPTSLLALRVTNSSGETDPVVVPTPDRDLSQAPEASVQPWTGLRVLIEHPEFEKVTLEGVQVFPGIETIQTVRLIPLLEFDPQYSGQQDFEFTPQPLWGGTAP